MKKRNKALKSTFTFDKNVARGLVDTSYYEAQDDSPKGTVNIRKNYEHIEIEKTRLSTPDWGRVTMILEDFRNIGMGSYESPVGKTLLGLYKKNKETNLPSRNTNLVSIVAKPEMLLMAYKEIRGNKGALTPGAEKSPQDLANMTEEQKEIYLKSNIFPDGFSLKDVLLVSRLIRKGLYPWGSSSRVYFDKPGVAVLKNNITIPPFLDRVVQKAIELVLQSIYEPIFEKTNRSFGFRPNKGVHDAIVALTSLKTNGMRFAVKGNIEAAYETVDREILIEILRKRVSDNKFIRLIEDRLDYDFVEKETAIRSKPTIGIPQDGRDSPYLFNIYMHELDTFVCTEVSKRLEEINQKKLGFPNVKTGRRKRVLSKEYSRIDSAIRKKRAELPTIKARIKESNSSDEQNTVNHLRKVLFRLVKDIRLLRHQKNRVTSIDPVMRELRIFYVRYADDWIVLTNGTKEIATYIKELLSVFLEKRLKLKLTESKTLITDITKFPAKFLGFQLRGTALGPLRRTPHSKDPGSRQKWVLNRISGLPTWASPDAQRQIKRMHMKGLCNKRGFPKEVPWLSTLEPHVIVERYNACIRGLGLFYLGYIRNNSLLHRWIYILRYSCLKTLAQKYKTSISGIFRKFGHKLHSKATSTIRVQAILKRGEQEYKKSWELLTYNDLKKRTLKDVRPKVLLARFWDAELRDKIGDYPLKKGRLPKVTNKPLGRLTLEPKRPSICPVQFVEK